MFEVAAIVNEWIKEDISKVETNKMRNLRLLAPYIVTLFCVSCLLLGCDSNELASEYVDKAKEEPAQFLESYFDLIREEHFDRAMEFYADDFYQVTSRESWLKYLSDINNNFGHIESTQFTQLKGISNVMGISNAGTYYEMEYFVAYRKGHTIETFLVYKPIIGKEQRIIGHVIHPQAGLVIPSLGSSLSGGFTNVRSFLHRGK